MWLFPCVVTASWNCFRARLGSNPEARRYRLPWSQEDDPQHILLPRETYNRVVSSFTPSCTSLSDRPSCRAQRPLSAQSFKNVSNANKWCSGQLWNIWVAIGSEKLLTGCKKSPRWDGKEARFGFTLKGTRRQRLEYISVSYRIRFSWLFLQPPRNVPFQIIVQLHIPY